MLFQAYAIRNFENLSVYRAQFWKKNCVITPNCEKNRQSERSITVSVTSNVIFYEEGSETFVNSRKKIK